MIRHRPLGSGHPYRIEPDQRVPPIPIEGEPFEVRATTSNDIEQLRVELDIDGISRVVQARRYSTDEKRRSDGHLAAAANRTGKGRRSWVARVDPLAFGSRLRYRFIAEGTDGLQQTRWFAVKAARWELDRGQLVQLPPPSPARGVGQGGGRLIPESVGWLVADAGALRVRFALRLEPKEHVVGFGERFNALDQRGRQLDAIVYEQYKGQGARTYMPMPFAIVAGRTTWGFYVDTSRRTWFEVGKTNADRLWIEAALDPGESDPTLNIYMLEGTPSEVLSAFLDRTGRPKLPPSWIFRPWMSGNEWNTQARVMDEVERSRREQIPVGVVVIEAWSDESTYSAFRDAQYPVHEDGPPHRLTDFRFPPRGAWPDPKRMVDELHSRGIKLLLWQIPLLKVRPAPGSQAAFDSEVMVNRGYAVREASGRPYRNRGWWFPGALMPDFTSTPARDWWLAKRRYLVDEVGVDGFKTDGGEHAWGDDVRYADGSRGDAGNNRYPVAYSAAYHQLFSSSGRDGITFSRAGFTGSPAYPCHWAGDEDSTWEAFRASITAGLTAGASGIFFWGWDLAGFSGEIPSAELYLRAAAMACFCPIMQYHSEFNHHRQPSRDRTPWNIAERTGDPRVLPTYRRFAELREKLVPYLTEEAALSVTTSKPLMRALFFDVPDDPEIWNWPYEYFLGDDLLVAPVTEPGVESSRIYLPRGEWIDAWTGETYVGPVVVERPTPLEEIPVYARPGRAAEVLPFPPLSG
jgi:alpha-glucosidase (family GH31 glycosyl hydrolase)